MTVAPAAPAARARRVRVGLCRSETGSRAESVVVVESCADALREAAAKKLRVAPRSVRKMVLRTAVGTHPIGTELPDGDLSDHLKDDALVGVVV